MIDKEKIKNSIVEEIKFLKAIQKNNLEVIKLSLRNESINPADLSNKGILLAFQNGYKDIVKLLWNDQRVKNSLHNDYPLIYNKLIKEDIQKKVSKF